MTQYKTAKLISSTQVRGYNTQFLFCHIRKPGRPKSQITVVAISLHNIHGRSIFVSYLAKTSVRSLLRHVQGSPAEAFIRTEKKALMRRTDRIFMERSRRKHLTFSTNRFIRLEFDITT